MVLKMTVKMVVEHIPYCIGKWIAKIPFSWRLGRTYITTKQKCVRFECATEEAKGAYALEHFAKVFERAKDFECYRKLYEDAGVLDLKIRTMDDIRKVPTIDKAWTRKHFGEFKGAYRLNTGGSSGEPTAFWMDKGCWAREWAHMHTIWEKLEYKYTDLKLAIRGKNLGARPFAYNPVHNEYIINTYLSVKDYAAELKKLFEKRRPKWFHGYPSSIYQFILECEAAFGKDGVHELFKCVTGLLLSSEYPHPYLVKKFEEYGLKWISWYGHSEMAVLAWADDAMVYHPFVTYGLSEVVGAGEGLTTNCTNYTKKEEVEHGRHLIGTSYHNFDMPLVRYDTGDLVEAVEGGFKIKEGRNGDFIEDRNGKKIPLTALIFGRHHKAFDVAEHVQIRQTSSGKATLIVTMKRDGDIRMSDMFDLSNVDVDFDMEIVDKPIRTPAGKLRLKV